MPPFRHKYHAKKVMVDGIVFDSQREYKRFLELQALEQAGKIKNLERQKTYVLIPEQTETYERISEKTGKVLKPGTRVLERACKYVADFVYEDAETGKTVVEDSKGFRTKEYLIKRKLMLWVNGIRIKEV